MTPDRFQQIRNLFDAALERDEDERAAFLAQASGTDFDLQERVWRLLQAHDATVTLRAPFSQPARIESASPETPRLGDYEILRLLGRGGMGNVYLARRSDSAFQKDVAVKIIRADMARSDLVRRFQMEREILADLEHPNIARLLDAGETEDGLPYFIMEYVAGQPITEYADSRRLTVKERLALFRQMCNAVDHAHHRNIVHRDLKPGNVLVTAEGQVKLLDFGIARLIEPRPGALTLTVSGAWPMTPEYASPEQVRGDPVGKASDIYSLGVILFELLTGHRPYRLRSRIFHEIVRVVCEESPTRPSLAITHPGEVSASSPETTARLRQTSLNDLRSQLAGDLDNVVLKALQKQPHDRYASVGQFSGDIERHQNGEPVWARSDSWRYRTGVRLARYRFVLIAAGALIAAIATGSVVVRWSAVWWIGGGAVFLALWRAATDRVIGQKVARSWLLSGPFVVMFFSALVSVVFMLVGRRLNWPVALAQVVFVLLVIPTIYSVGFWFYRGRWTGSLLMDLGTEVRPLISLAFVAALCNFSLLRQLPSGRGLTYMLWYGAAWAAVICLNLSFNVFRPLEIRRGGFIVKQGRFIPWSRIRSWTWEPKLPASDWPFLPSKILVLQLYRPVQFLPPVRIEISGADVEAVDVLLKQQLGDWPSAG